MGEAPIQGKRVSEIRRRTACGKALPRPSRICEKPRAMADYRIAKIALDEDTILWRNADVEQERRVAIYDLIEDNVFKPVRAVEAGYHGPYDLRLAVQDGRLALAIASHHGDPLETLILGLARFRRPIRDYFAICDSYYQAIRKATPAEIETIDMARRAIHNDAADLLLERLDGKVETDHPTARRLFTLICVLHIKN
jgi:uncharacterized protein (UPF0262 family)